MFELELFFRHLTFQTQVLNGEKDIKEIINEKNKATENENEVKGKKKKTDVHYWRCKKMFC